MRRNVCDKIVAVMRKKIDAKWGYPALLALAVLFVAGLSLPEGTVYGSTTDWFSQHVALAETIRTECVRQGTLLPEYLALGGGSNGFLFSYYGYLRPDIVAGCLLPGVSMLRIVIAYMLLEYIISTLLFYRLLLADGQSRFASFWGSMLFLLAACFFHTHRQVMFINYMPYLLAAMLLVKKRRYGWVSVCLALAYCNSFYYAPAALAVLGWYWLRQEGRPCFLRYTKAAALSIGMASALLIPTGLVILEHRRGGAGASLDGLLQFQWEFDGLLYTPYGIGLTVICLYALFAGLGIRGLRADGICYLCACGFAVVPWVLNATLYARSKILIPFLPLVVLHCVRVFGQMERMNWYAKLLPFAPLAVVACAYRGKARFGWIAAEALVLLCVILLMRRGRGKRGLRLCYLALLILPACFCLRTARTEQYVSVDSAVDPSISQAGDRHWEVASVGQMVASVRAGKEAVAGTVDAKIVINQPDPAQSDTALSYYRTESLYEPLNTANRYIRSAGDADTDGVTQKGAMYSSITNAAYSGVWYDLLLTPIQINNRVAVLPADNPFLLQLMGVRFVQTAPDRVPDGYRVRELGENSVLAENDRVLPMAYMVADYMAEDEFERLHTYDRLDAVTRTTIVDFSPEDGAGTYESRMEPYEPVFSSCNAEGIRIEPDGDGAWVITAEKGAKLELTLSEPLTDEILLLSFAVERRTKDAVVIDINQIRNKLSGKGAAYPNGNSEFHYQFSESDADGVAKLVAECSAGSYRISDVQWRRYAKENMYQKEIVTVEPRETQGNEILSCAADAEGEMLFVTSIPVQRGMELLIDGEPAAIRTVNQAFAGGVVPAGRHEIRLVFRAPGLRAGYAVSLAALAFTVWDLVRNARRRS